MRRLALLFAMISVAHVAEALVTPQRVAAATTTASRVWNALRGLWYVANAPLARRLIRD